MFIFFINSKIGWAGGYGTGLLKTTDGGMHWKKISPISNQIRSIHFVDKNNGWIIASYRVLRTTDGGRNWSYQPAFSGFQWPYDVFFINKSVGWVAGAGTKYQIMKTTDGGETWIPQNTPTEKASHTLYDIVFLDENNGWAVGTNGIILHTENGGQTWQLQKIDTIDDFYSVYFLDKNHGWIAGGGITYDGIIVKTTNGGKNWITQEDHFMYPLHSIYFTDVDHGWTVGGGGCILSTATGGICNGCPPPELLPKRYVVFQNYPNPFNSYTTIKLQILKPMVISLSIYDLNGRKVATLIDNQLLFGSKEIIWHAENYSSGIYFYRIEADGSSEAKKCMLIK